MLLVARELFVGSTSWRGAMNKVGRYRLRFSIRSLLILVTIVCLFLTCWIQTSSKGVRDLSRHEISNYGSRYSERAVFPLLVAADERSLEIVPGMPRAQMVTRSKYFIWLFGWLIELPIGGRPQPFAPGHIIQGEPPRMPADFYEQGLRS
jgi:hypothetical protein